MYGILNAELKLALPWFCDHHFKHHLHTQTTQTLIKKYEDLIKTRRPKFILESLVHDYPKGKHTSKSLPASILEYIKESYTPLYQSKEFIFYHSLNNFCSKLFCG